MPLNHDRLSNWTFEDRVHRYDARNTILYALGVGCGDDAEDLPFVYEEGLVALPSMATVLGDPGFWLKDPELDAGWSKAVHGEQSIVLHTALPASGTVVARNAVDQAIDKAHPRRRHAKLLVLANTLISQNRLWSPIAP